VQVADKEPCTCGRLHGQEETIVFVWLFTVGRALSASVSAITALIVAYIAVAQYFINRQQYRLALFERRMVVYNSTMNMLASVIQSTRPSIDQAFQYLRETRDHEFLFGSEVKTLIDELYKKVIALEMRNSMGSEAVTQRTEILNWFPEKMGEARKVFLRYLDFRKP
jgi:hypothetical protein